MSSISIITVVGLALISAIFGLFLQQSRLPSLALILVLAAGSLIFILLLPSLNALIAIFSDLSALTGISDQYLAIIIKVIGIAYIAEFGGQLCRDCGQGSLALKIEFAAKIIILLLATPIISGISQTILGLLS